MGIAADRSVIFGYFLTGAGLQYLTALLDSGGYRVEIPEDAALLTLAWLLQAGDREAALDVLDAISPFAAIFRFAPKVADIPTSPPDFVHRITAGQATALLANRKLNPKVEAQREALAIWNPLADRILTLWLEKYDDGHVTIELDPDWQSRAAALVREYDRLASAHTTCSKHKRPKENLAILLGALRAAALGQRVPDRALGLLRNTIAASLNKRGVPGMYKHTGLRAPQRDVANAPAHSKLAAVAAHRLQALDQSAGIEQAAPLAIDVTSREAAESGLPAGTPMPQIVDRVLARAHSAPVEELLTEGVVPSAEVLAELVPRISATVVAASFGDAALARLAAANYRAFCRRRSVLLLNLAKQVQLSELPWVQAMTPHSNATADEAKALAQRVGALTLDYFPATILPNPLVQELQHLLAAAGHDVPLVEELAADIFEGRFSDKYRRAAQTTVRIVGGTLYARYFGIDTDQILGLAESPKKRWGSPWRRPQATEDGLSFGALCSSRAGQKGGRWRSVPANGTIIEQSQILTTHNLAALVDLGIRPTRSWADLARESIEQTAAKLALAARQPRPLPTVKDAAYAWRQAIFYLSVADPTEAHALINDDLVSASAPAVMHELLAGLRVAADGREGATDDHRPFLGWTVGRHWILDAIGYKPVNAT